MADDDHDGGGLDEFDFTGGGEDEAEEEEVEEPELTEDQEVRDRCYTRLLDTRTSPFVS
jgi:hypothetical protein